MEQLRTQQEIIGSWQGTLEEPVVSICCATYNHEKFIRDALHGFLIQKTRFPFEILIHDDASLDHTADIIREYERRYPLLIKAIYQKENQYSQGKKPLSLLHSRSRGTYIAVCEGDDFWTDPRKLAIQVAFLDNNPEYVMSGHDAHIVDENGNIIHDSQLPFHCKRDLTADEMMTSQSIIMTLSWVFRNIAIELPPEARMVDGGDRFYVSLLGQHGKSKYHADVKPGCYRAHQGGVWSGLSKAEQRNARLNTLLWICRYYSRIRQHHVAEYCWNVYVLKVLLNANPIALACLLVKMSYVRVRCALVRWL